MDNTLSAETDAARLERETRTRAAKARLTAVGDVLRERAHQIERGHTPLGDSAHSLGELSRAAAACIAAGDDIGQQGALFADWFWPFDYREVPKSSEGWRRLLVKAAALLIAELERLPRATDPAADVRLLGYGGGNR